MDVKEIQKNPAWAVFELSRRLDSVEKELKELKEQKPRATRGKRKRPS